MLSVAINLACRCWLAVVAGLCVLLGSNAEAQILRGLWVDEAEYAIEKHRKDDVTFIVLDANDRPIDDANIHVRQLRHAFALGFAIPATGSPPAEARSEPLYRCMNALAMERLTQWTSADRQWNDDHNTQADAWLDAFDPVRCDFGPVIASDPAHNFDGLSKLEPADAAGLINQRIAKSIEFNHRITHRDLYVDTAGSADLREELGIGAIHHFFEMAHAAEPEDGLNLRVINGLDSLNSRKIAERIQGYELRKLPFTGITIDQQFAGTVQPVSLMRTLTDRTAILPAPVTIANLEVGGTSEIAAALNLETVVRLLFAQPRIEAIYFNGLGESQMLDPLAALVNPDGSLTASGELIDALFHKHWRSDLNMATDSRGQASTRLFKGWYEIEVVFPDGQSMTRQAYINQNDDQPRFVVIQRGITE